MAGGMIGTGYGALDFLMAGGGGSSAYGVNPYSTNTSSIFDLFGGGGGGSSYGSSIYDPYGGYTTSVTAGQNSGSGHLASDQVHVSSQAASAALDGNTQNNLYSQQKDLQKVNVFLDPQIGPGRSGTNMPVGGFMNELLNVSTEGSAASTDVDNNQEIGLDQSAYAEEGGTAINNAYQVQNNVQIVNLYLDLNLQLPGMPQNPWMSNPWMPGGAGSTFPTYGVPQTQGYGSTGYGAPVGGTYPTGAPQATQPAPEYDPSHLQPYTDFVMTTTDLEYSDRSQLRETIKEYGRFFDENGSRSLGRAFMTLAGAVGSGENIDRAERRFLRFEDAVFDLDEEEKAYFYEALNALSDEVSYTIEDTGLADEISFILDDLGYAVTGLTYDDLGYGDGTDGTTDGVDVAA